MENYFKEAFQRLKLLEDDFDISVDKDKVDELKSFVADDIEVIPEEEIIDVNAENETELQDNYIGKVILECDCCHTRIYKDEEDIIIDPETQLANIDEECPVCNNSLGFVVIGKIEPFDADREIKPEEEVVEEENAEELPADDVTEEEEVEEVAESLANRLARKHLEESEKLTEKRGVSWAVAAGNEGSYESRPQGVINLLRKYYLRDNDYPVIVYRNNTIFGEGETREEIQDIIDRLSLEESKVDLTEGYYTDGDSIIDKDTNEEVARYTVNNDNGEIIFKVKALKELSDAEKKSIDESLNEDFKEVEIKTDDQKLEMTSDENGKVTVTTEPLESITEEPEDAETGAEEIVPLDTEEEIEIEDNSEEIEEPEETVEVEAAEVEEAPEEEIEDFDEESFDELGESYMRRVYENVKSFKTTSLRENSRRDLIIEGLITFNSGNQIKTNFKFNNRYISKDGKLVLEGLNKNFSHAPKSFILRGTLTEGKFTPKSMIYNYKVKRLNESLNSKEVIKVYGRVKTK